MSNISINNQQLNKKGSQNSNSKMDKLSPLEQSNRPIIQQTQNHKYQKNQLQNNITNPKKPVSQHFVCTICQQSFPKLLSVRMCYCQHVFCWQCLNAYVLNQLKSIQEITCPQQFVNSLLDEKSPFYQSLSEQIKKIYEKNKLAYEILKDPTLRHCPTQNCQGILKITNLQICFCNVCQKWRCKYCFRQQHKGLCKHQVNHLQDILHYQQCPKCKIMVQKTQACNHMTCKCKHQFCYTCGQTWRPEHRCPQKNNQLNNRLMRDQRINPDPLYLLCCCIGKIIFFLLTWIFYIPMLVIAFLLLCFFLGPSCALLGLLIGLLYGPIEQFRQICNLQDQYIIFILIIFFPIPIVIGIVRGIIKYENQALINWGTTCIDCLRSIKNTIIRSFNC